MKPSLTPFNFYAYFFGKCVNDVSIPGIVCMNALRTEGAKICPMNKLLNAKPNFRVTNAFCNRDGDTNIFATE